MAKIYNKGYESHWNKHRWIELVYEETVEKWMEISGSFIQENMSCQWSIYRIYFIDYITD